MVQIGSVMLDVGFVAKRAKLVVVNHFRIRNLRDGCTNFGELSLSPVGCLLNTVRSSDRRIGSLAAKCGRPTGSSTRDRAYQNDTDEGGDQGPAKTAASFIRWRKHGLSPEKQIKSNIAPTAQIFVIPAAPACGRPRTKRNTYVDHTDYQTFDADDQR
jgi:hypothetical protein